MKIRTVLTMLVSSLLIAASCSKVERENMFSKQSENIEKYVNSYLDKNPDTRVSFNDGIVRMIITEGDGEALSGNGTATILYAGYVFNNGQISSGNMFTTNDPDVAAAAKWKLSDESIFVPAEVSPADKSIVEGLRKGLEGAREGEECVILFTGKYGFSKCNGTISANAALAWNIKIQKIIN